MLAERTCHLYVFILLLVQVQSTGEGEAQRYFDHALTLRNTILFLRHNKDLGAQAVQPDQPNNGTENTFKEILQTVTSMDSSFRLSFCVAKQLAFPI